MVEFEYIPFIISLLFFYWQKSKGIKNNKKCFNIPLQNPHKYLGPCQISNYMFKVTIDTLAQGVKYVQS